MTSGTLVSGTSITTDVDFDPLGNLDRVIDADSNVIDYLVDALPRAYKVTDALSNDTDYGFDAQDNVTLVTAPNGATTSLPHDGLGNADSARMMKQLRAQIAFEPARGALAMTR